MRRPIFAALLIVARVTKSGAAAKNMAVGGWDGLGPRGLAGTYLQAFAGALGGMAAPGIVYSGDETRPYAVSGDTFPDYATAAGRSCDTQKNNCAGIANGVPGAGFTVGDCEQQSEECKAAAASATDTAFSVLVSEDAQFEYYCDL